MRPTPLLISLPCLLLAAPTWAGEVTFGGYYRFHAISEDKNLLHEQPGEDVYRTLHQRLQLKLNLAASSKTHAHLVMRPVDDDPVQGMGSSFMESAVGAQAVSGRVESAEEGLSIRQLWLESEMAGVGIKVGEMPLMLNDRILLHDDTKSSYGGLVLSKTFTNRMTAVLGNVRMDENNPGGASSSGKSNRGASDDDLDLYFGALMGQWQEVRYNLTLALLDGREDSVLGTTALSTLTDNGLGNTNNLWTAVTLDGKLGEVTWVGTLIRESGYEHVRTGQGMAWMDQLAGSGAMAALRLKGPAPWGEWNAYGFWGSRNFDSLANLPNWSLLYDSPGSDLMQKVLLGSDATRASKHDNNAPHADSSGENAYGLGLGAKFKLGIWQVNPQLDLASLTDANYHTSGVTRRAYVQGGLGGSLKVSTPLDKETQLSLVASYVSILDHENQLNSNKDDLHTLLAEIKMAF